MMASDFGKIKYYKHTLVLKVNGGRFRKEYRQYYRRNKKKTTKFLNPNHITIISMSEMKKLRKLNNTDLDELKQYDGEEIFFKYCPIPRINDPAIVIKVQCDAIGDLREGIGLSRNGKYFPHITLTYLKNKANA